MKNLSIYSSTAVLLILVPFAPMAHARVAPALTADIGIHTAGDASVGTSATDAAGPIVITRASAGVILSASAEIQSSGSGSTMSASVAEGASSRDAIRAHAAALTAHDARIASITLSSQNVSLTYYALAKLLGFISLEVPVEVSVDAAGTTQVSYPWYRFLLATDQAGLAIRTQAAVTNSLATEGTTSSALSAGTQMRLLDSLHVVMQDTVAVQGAVHASTE